MKTRNIILIAFIFLLGFCSNPDDILNIVENEQVRNLSLFSVKNGTNTSKATLNKAITSFNSAIGQVNYNNKNIEDSLFNAKNEIKNNKVHKSKKTLLLVNDPKIKINNKSVAFNLFKVTTAKSLLREKDYIEAIKTRPINKIEYCNADNYKLVPSYYHPFAEAVEKAYADHRPLVISPDIIWLLCCQGFSKNMEVNPGRYRNKIVDFGEMKRIDIVRKDFIRGVTDSLWPEIVKEFSDEAKDKIIDTAFHSTFVHSFSTTTDKELVAFNISFLEINKRYFEFKFAACGIPKIILKGETEDWIWMRKNIEQFRDFELSWWVDKIIPLLDEFINTSKGDVNLEFWSKIYRDELSCDHPITGWFTMFFPYIRKGGEFYENPLVFNDSEDSNYDADYALENENFPSGLSNVEFNFFDSDNKKYEMSFVAGFVGVKQDSITKALKPEINWLIAR